MDENLELSPKGTDPVKRLIQWLYKTKSSRLTFRANFKGKNRLIWRQFRLTYVDDEEKPYAMCVDCQTFVKYSSRTGTGGLVRHYCFRQVVATLEGRNEPQFLPDIPKATTTTPGRFEIEELITQSSPRVGYVPNFKGKSNVWNQFDIITLDNEPVNFAACKLCRSIVTYISRTGTGSMARHKCNLVKRGATPDQTYLPEDLAKRVKQETEDEENVSGDAPTMNNNLAQLQLNAFSQMLQANLKNFRGKSEVQSDVLENPEIEPCAISNIPPPPSTSATSPSTSQETPEEIVRREYIKMLRRSLDVFHAMRNESFYDLAQSLVNMGAEYGKIDIRLLLNSCSEFDSVLNVVD